MKLLLDQNLAPSLKRRLADLNVEIAHVKDFSLEAADDTAIWDLAQRNGYTIVSKDEDFRARVALVGHPPKVILLKIGNCPLTAVEGCIRGAWNFIGKLHEQPGASLLMITPLSAFILHPKPPA